VEHPARHRNVEPISGDLLDEPQSYFGRTFSRAKEADARLRISISVTRTRVMRRNSTNSRLSAVISPSRWPLSTSPYAIHRRRHDSLMPRSRALAATGSPCATRSNARRRNSGDLGAGIPLTTFRDDHRLRSCVRENGSRSTRVMAVAAENLGTKPDGPRIKSVHLLGAAMGAKGYWETLSSAVDDAVYC